MAKSNLDQVVRALVGVDRDHLGVVVDIANRLNSPDRSRWHDRFTGVLQEGLPQVEPPPPLLVFDNTRFASVDLSGPHDPATFWQTTHDAPARYVWTNVFAYARSVDFTDIIKMPYADLPRGTTGGNILAAPGVGNFDVSKLSKVIGKMIAKQPNGEPGYLLSDGKANLFPCGSLIVFVHWDVASRYWRVNDWHPAFKVDAYRRVFSGNLIL